MSSLVSRALDCRASLHERLYLFFERHLYLLAFLFIFCKSKRNIKFFVDFQILVSGSKIDLFDVLSTLALGDRPPIARLRVRLANRSTWALSVEKQSAPPRRVMIAPFPDKKFGPNVVFYFW